MNRARFALAAALVGVSVSATPVLAQSAPKAPEFKSVLAGKKVQPPFKGQAEVEFTTPVTKKDPKSNMVVTTLKVKNMANAPLQHLTVDETWFDKSNAIVGGSSGSVAMLQPGEVQTITIQTPYNSKMNGNGYNFTHAYGTVKTKRVTSLDDPAGKEPATKTASATKTSKKK